MSYILKLQIFRFSRTAIFDLFSSFGTHRLIIKSLRHTKKSIFCRSDKNNRLLWWLLSLFYLTIEGKRGQRPGLHRRSSRVVEIPAAPGSQSQQAGKGSPGGHSLTSGRTFPSPSGLRPAMAVYTANTNSLNRLRKHLFDISHNQNTFANLRTRKMDSLSVRLRDRENVKDFPKGDSANQ